MRPNVFDIIIELTQRLPNLAERLRHQSHGRINNTWSDHKKKQYLGDSVKRNIIWFLPKKPYKICCWYYYCCFGDYRSSNGTASMATHETYMYVLFTNINFAHHIFHENDDHALVVSFNKIYARFLYIRTVPSLISKPIQKQINIQKNVRQSPFSLTFPFNSNWISFKWSVKIRLLRNR